MRQFRAEIISNGKFAANHHILSFKMPGAVNKVKPGQFFSIKISDSYEPLLRKPFGAHKIGKDAVTILYKIVGNATRILSNKKKGDRLDVLGPIGNGFDLGSSLVSRPSSFMLVAGGHGVAPLYALAKRITPRLRSGQANHKSRITIFIGAKTKKEVVGDKELRKLDAKVYIATDDGSKGHKGLVTDLLEQHINPLTRSPAHPLTIYACGPKPMLKAVAGVANRHKIPCQLSLEEYMACGIGTCLGCAVKTRSGYKMVCKDGPVFDAKEIIW